MSTYKQQLQAAIENEKQTTQAALTTFMDRSLSMKKRLNAAKICGTFNTAEDIELAIAIYRDPNEVPEIRAAALMGLSNYANGNEQLTDELIGVLKEETTSSYVKEAAMSVLQSNTFSSPIMNAKRPDYNDALKSIVVSNEAPDLKLRATEYLAMDKDEFIQRKLLDGLLSGQNDLVKPEEAIQLLSYDLHADIYSTLKKIAANPPNLRAKKEALRSLASDPSAADLLLETLNNKNEDKEIRHVCAVGLQTLQPESLQNSLKTILTDKKENTQLQVALLNTLNYTENTYTTDNDRQFQVQLENLTKNSNSKKLKKTYESYINNKSRNNF